MTTPQGGVEKALLLALGGVVTAGILGAVMYHEGAVIILGFCSVVTTSLLSTLSQSQHSRATTLQVEKVAAKTAQVSAKVDDLAQTTNATHSLVNSRMGLTLQLAAVTARRLATITKDPEDVRMAEAAEKAWAEHQAQQASADAVVGTGGHGT